MKQSKEHHLKLKNAIVSAYFKRGDAEISEQWQAKTMRHIRGLGPLDSKAVYLTNFQQLLWRFAPVLCALIIIFAVFLFSMDFSPGFEMADLFLDDPLEYSFVQSFGM